MQISAIGPLAIDGRTVEGARLPALLLPLLLARGRIVAIGELVEAVWEGAPPADPTGALHALVSRTRRLGLTISATAGGYRLDPAELDVDVLTAQDLLGQARAAIAGGDPARASDLAARGLALWPADDGASTVGPSGRAFTDLLTIRVEGALAATGDASEPAGSDVPDDGLLDALRRAVRLQPADEPLVALLMRALAARGRDAEALAVYERLRTELAETYGTDPSGVVAQTHLALLRGELLRGELLRGEQERAGQPDDPQSSTDTPAAALLPSTNGPLPALAPALAPPSWRRPTTSMVGRDADVVALERQLAEHALVTVVAVGGAGKTRLAVEVARRASERGEAVYAVELAGLRDPAEVLPALLSAAGSAESAPEVGVPHARRSLDSHERMLRAVANLTGLLVLDNCEHVLAAAADVAAQVLGAAGPGLRVLATSRAPLGIVGEVVHPIDALPDAAALAVLEARGRAVRPTLAWDPAAALELCHRLDNLPLALELAAARMRSMPLADVLAGVSHRFALLDDALRGLPDRHRGLWAMVDWSWALLDAQCRGLLRDLAVFPAPFTAAAAAAVGRGVDAGGAAAALTVLVEQSLLILEEPDGGRPARYRMLETVREYGEARLAADGGRDIVMDRLARWAALEARALRGRYIGADQLATLRAAGDDHDTFVVALRWATDNSRDRQAYALAAMLLGLWTIRGLHLEVIAWARQLVHSDAPERRRALWERLRADRGGRPGEPGLEVPDAEDAICVATMSMLNSAIASDLRTAILGRRIARWALAVGTPRLSARTVAIGEFMMLSFRTWTTELTDELAACNTLVASADPYLHALGLIMRASLQENHGDLAASAKDARLAYGFFEQVGDHWGMGMSAQAIGQWEVGNDDETDLWLTRAIDNCELIGAVQDARTLVVTRDLKRAINGSADAIAALEAVGTSSTGFEDERARAQVGLGVLAAQSDRWDDAVQFADAAVRTARGDRSGMPHSRIITEVACAVLRLRAGKSPGTLLEVAAHSALTLTDMPILGSVALGFSELAASRGDTALADDLWAMGMRLGANLATIFSPLSGLATAHRSGGPQVVQRARDVQRTRDALLARAREVSVEDTVARLTSLIEPAS